MMRSVGFSFSVDSEKPPSFSVERNKRRLVEFLFPYVDL